MFQFCFSWSIFYLFITLFLQVWFSFSLFLLPVFFSFYLPFHFFTTTLTSSVSHSPPPVLVMAPVTVLELWCLHAAPGSWLFGALNSVCLSKGMGLTYSAATALQATARSACPQWDIAEENSGLLVLSLALVPWFSRSGPHQLAVDLLTAALIILMLKLVSPIYPSHSVCLIVRPWIDIWGKKHNPVLIK